MEIYACVSTRDTSRQDSIGRIFQAWSSASRVHRSELTTACSDKTMGMIRQRMGRTKEKKTHLDRLLGHHHLLDVVPHPFQIWHQEHRNDNYHYWDSNLPEAEGRGKEMNQRLTDDLE